MQAGTGTVTDDQIRASYTRTRSKKRVAKELHISERRVRKVIGATSGQPQAEPQEVSPVTAGGFALAGKSLLAKKPTDVWKGRFFALRRGIGYRVETLQAEWSASDEIIRSHARDHGALRYIEDPDAKGQYIACIVHPDTPKGK
jgi:hypothetical protein